MLKQIQEIPVWKRILTCWILRRKAWRIAKAHNTVALEAWDNGETLAIRFLRDLSEVYWARVYGLDEPKPQTVNGLLREIERLHDVIDMKNSDETWKKQLQDENSRLRNLCRQMRMSFRRTRGRSMQSIPYNWPR